jgi:hypothetical protein
MTSALQNVIVFAALGGSAFYLFGCAVRMVRQVLLRADGRGSACGGCGSGCDSEAGTREQETKPVEMLATRAARSA